jgi:hypothetical protein
MRKHVTAGIAAAAVAGLVLAGCTSSQNANSTEHQEANAGLSLLFANQPVPIFPTSELRKNLIEVEAIQALGTPTTTFFFPEGTSMAGGKFSAPPFRTCASQGEPIHATDELSNPQQIIGTGNGNSQVVGQADPNGIYAGNSTGTYVLCVTASGIPKMAYWEGPVETESGAAVWDSATGTITDIGPSQLPVCTLKTAADGDGTGLKAGTPYYHCVKA